MLKKADHIFPNLHAEEPVDFKSASKRGDFDKFKEIIAKGKDWIKAEVLASDLRGRGGAGFSTGKKWSFIAPHDGKRPHYLIINADEGEPGTCKDREILLNEPYKLIEGCIYAACAIETKAVYIYIRGEFVKEKAHIDKAIAECLEKRIIGPKADFPVEIYTHPGAGAYICGEETALIESLEGKRGMPRFKPPFPAQMGLYSCPSVVNNVETIASVPAILKRGASWFSSLGRPHNTGTKVFCISGHVNHPCVVEEEMGVPFKYLIEKYAGGIKGGWNNLLGIIPGGSSTPVIKAENCFNLNMDYDYLHEADSSFGTAGIIVLDKETDIIKVIARLSKFYAHESCGQCSPCREGTHWVNDIMQRIINNKGTLKDLDTLKVVSKQMIGHTICALAEAAALPVLGLINNFYSILEERVIK